MATYKQIQQHIRQTQGFPVETCWIADVKSGYGLTTRIAPNRADASKRIKPCPQDKRAAIEQALRHFKMIG